jgi:glutamine amidotransferase
VVKDVAARGTPVMGICLGMQLLLEKSYEFGVHAGLSLIPGEVRPIAEVIPADLKIPHIGWNALIDVKPHPIFASVKPGDCVYFVHSYYGAKCGDAVIANAEYGAPLTAAVARGNVAGCQFHPEKSGDVGLGILKSFINWNGEA